MFDLVLKNVSVMRSAVFRTLILTMFLNSIRLKGVFLTKDFGSNNIHVFDRVRSKHKSNTSSG